MSRVTWWISRLNVGPLEEEAQVLNLHQRHFSIDFEKAKVVARIYVN